MDYYSAIKRIMSFAATWRGLEIIVRNKVRKRPPRITYPEYDANQLIHEIETDSQT